MYQPRLSIELTEHLFEEPGTLQEVARLAAQWFEAHLSVPSQLGPGR